MASHRSPSAEWDACAGAGNPFVSHAFLAILEASGSATADAGWQPLPIVIQGGDGAPAAIAPAYAKSHSQGEYVFDHGWADAWERAGGRYYPKIQVAVPFTAGAGPAIAGAGSRAGARADRGDRGGDRAEPALLRARHLRVRRAIALVRARGVAGARGDAVSLAQCGLCRLRRLPRGARQPQAQGDPARARRRAGGADRPPPDRRRDHRGALGRLLGLLPGYRQPQMGAALSDARLLLDARRGDGRAGAADPRRA